MAQHSEVLVIGAGLAGAAAALILADAGHEVTLIVPGPEPDGGNSALAQGGIIHRPNPEDGPLLERDILVAGHNWNHRRAVERLSKQGPEALAKLLLDRVPVPFDRNPDGTLNFTREGGHSTSRIIHCADHTGRTVMEHLLAAVFKAPGITILTGRTAVDLITTHHHSRCMEYRYHLVNECLGAYVLNSNSGEVETLFADWTVLASGGVGQVYLHTTNCAEANGSGIVMARRAGVRVDNMEYVQFHPTALYDRQAHRFLITEALRGEGGRLVDDAGVPFMAGYDARKDLAPRDIVARSIMDKMLRTGAHCVYLDLSEVRKNIPERFPTIYRRCFDIGIDIERQPIPVVPAAHYFCGGILTDGSGRTTLERLYAVGECACTGLHGANRLASTSLLEALLWGMEAAEDIDRRTSQKYRLSRRITASVPEWKSPGNEHNDDPALLAQDWATIRNTMWNYVGISRSRSRLQRAFEDLRDLTRRSYDFYKGTPLSKPIVDFFHGCQTAYGITQAALRNPESLGCHHRID